MTDYTNMPVPSNIPPAAPVKKQPADASLPVTSPQTLLPASLQTPSETNKNKSLAENASQETPKTTLGLHSQPSKTSKERQAIKDITKAASAALTAVRLQSLGLPSINFEIYLGQQL